METQLTKLANYKNWVYCKGCSRRQPAELLTDGKCEDCNKNPNLNINQDMFNYGN